MTDAITGIADRVRGVLAEKRVTQSRVAATLGLSRTSIGDRMSGRVPFTAAEVFTLSTALRVPVIRFFPDPAEVEVSRVSLPTSEAVAS